MKEEIKDLKRSLAKYPVHENYTLFEQLEDNPTAEEIKGVFQQVEDMLNEGKNYLVIFLLVGHCIMIDGE